MEDPKKTKMRLLKELGGFAKQMKADNLRKKYAPKPAVDELDAAVDAAHLPNVDDVKAELDGDATLDAVEAQAEPNQKLAEDTVDENKRALAELDDEKLKALLQDLRK
jgi:hypothetical protein